VHTFIVVNVIKYFSLDDGLKIDADTINKAKKNNGEALCQIGYEYQMELKDHSKAMAWYQRAANQNNLMSQCNIGFMYANGYGVSRDNRTAMECFLKGAGDNNTCKLNAGVLFLNGNGVPADKYKALEWFTKSGEKPEKAKELNGEGLHLRDEDKGKLFY
jgi:TPR repeat protein